MVPVKMGVLRGRLSDEDGSGIKTKEMVVGVGDKSPLAPFWPIPGEI